MVRAGRDFKHLNIISSKPPAMVWDTFQSIRLLWAPSNRSSNTSRDGDYLGKTVLLAFKKREFWSCLKKKRLIWALFSQWCTYSIGFGNMKHGPVTATTSKTWTEDKVLFWMHIIKLDGLFSNPFSLSLSKLFLRHSVQTYLRTIPEWYGLHWQIKLV